MKHIKNINSNKIRKKKLDSLWWQNMICAFLWPLRVLEISYLSADRNALMRSSH